MQCCFMLDSIIRPSHHGEDDFYIVLFIVLAILQVPKSGCAHSFPPLNKVGFSVIYFYDCV